MDTIINAVIAFVFITGGFGIILIGVALWLGFYALFYISAILYMLFEKVSGISKRRQKEYEQEQIEKKKAELAEWSSNIDVIESFIFEYVKRLWVLHVGDRNDIFQYIFDKSLSGTKTNDGVITYTHSSSAVKNAIETYLSSIRENLISQKNEFKPSNFYSLEWVSLDFNGLSIQQILNGIANRISIHYNDDYAEEFLKHAEKFKTLPYKELDKKFKERWEKHIDWHYADSKTSIHAYFYKQIRIMVLEQNSNGNRN